MLDHEDRELPTPAYKVKGRFLVIDTEDPAFDELLNDARHYAIDGPDLAPAGLKYAAKALLRAVSIQREQGRQ